MKNRIALLFCLMMLSGAANAETWACQEGETVFDDSKPTDLVLRNLVGDPSSEDVTVTIGGQSFNAGEAILDGNKYTAFYQTVGLDRMWFFGFHDDYTGFNHSISLLVSGVAGYSKVTDEGLQAPSRFFKCRLQKL